MGGNGEIWGEWGDMGGMGVWGKWGYEGEWGYEGNVVYWFFRGGEAKIRGGCKNKILSI